MIKKQCIMCFKLFDTIYPNARICSDDCREVRVKEHVSNRYQKMKGKPKAKVSEKTVTCGICSKEFTPKTGMCKYCSHECRIIKRNNKKI